MGDKVILGADGSGSKAGRFLTYAVRARGFVFTTISRGHDPATFDPSTETGVLATDLSQEIRFALERQRDVLKDAGSDLEHVLKVNLYVNGGHGTDPEFVNAEYDKFFSDHGVAKPPVRCTVEVAFVEGRIAVDLMATAAS
jgi:2-iminobutanoate/2-iminopropanoate deaminase